MSMRMTGLVAGAALFLPLLAGGVVLSGCGGSGQEGHEGHDHGAMSKEAPAQIAQKTCPVMGGKIDPKVFTDYGGRRIYFCCPGCIADFKKDPAKFLGKVDAEISGKGKG